MPTPETRHEHDMETSTPCQAQRHGPKRSVSEPDLIQTPSTALSAGDDHEQTGADTDIDTSRPKGNPLNTPSLSSNTSPTKLSSNPPSEAITPHCHNRMHDHKVISNSVPCEDTNCEWASWKCYLNNEEWSSWKDYLYDDNNGEHGKTVDLSFVNWKLTMIAEGSRPGSRRGRGMSVRAENVTEGSVGGDEHGEDKEKDKEVSVKEVEHGKGETLR